MEQTPASLVAETKPPVKKSSSKKVKMLVLLLFVCVIFGVVAVAAFMLLYRPSNVTQSPNSNTNTSTPDITVARSPFSNIKVEEVAVTPNVPAYDLGSDNANVVNLNRFEFNAEIKNKLLTDKFAVVQRDQNSSDRTSEEFFKVYEQNRYEQIPSFITTDAVLHNYHLVFDDTLKTLETTIFTNKVKNAVRQMYDLSETQYGYFIGSDNIDLGNAASRNTAYFAVALKLLGEDVQVQDYIKAEVDQELALIEAHDQITLSPVVNMFSTEPETGKYKEDYTQYIPRGHYTATPELQKYFKAMIWLGRITFRQKNDSENMSALLMVQGMNASQGTMKEWSDVYDAIGFIVGNADDLGIYEYTKVAGDVFGTLSNENLTNPELQSAFFTQIKKLSPPSINSIPIFDESINPDREAEIKGFRFMGQRYTIDANVFQDLIYRSVKENSNGERRMLPKSLDLMAAMGSDKAMEILDSQGVTDFEKYPENMTALKTKISSFDESYWTSNLYNGWLYMIKPMLSPVGQNFPEFMQNDNWVKKDMNTYQGSWTELKHDTILYAKQNYAEAGAGGYVQPIDLDYRGYVEPRTDVYARMEALAKSMNAGLSSRGLLEGQKVEIVVQNELCAEGNKPSFVSDDQCKIKTTYDPAAIKENIQGLVTLSGTLKTISAKELENQALTDEENTFIKEFGAKLEHTWVQTLHKGEIRANDISTNLDKNPSMLVADIATDPNGTVLEEGTGRLMDIFVIIPASGSNGNYLRVARGLVFSQYEFTQPIAERLNDQQWQQKVRNGDVPAFESWKDFITLKTNVNHFARPGSYKESIEKGYLSESDAKSDCEQFGGTFVPQGNACSEDNASCGRIEPICKYY